MLTFEEEGHVYKWNNKIVPSVTQIMSRVGVQDDRGYWHSLTGAEYIKGDTASIFGSKFHHFAHLYLTGWVPKYSESMAPWVRGFEKFWSEHSELEIVEIDGQKAVEWMGYCKIYNYAGTLDLLCRNTKTGMHVIVDWKTSTQWQGHWWKQFGAYSEIVKQNTGIKAIATMPVRIYEDGYEAREHSPAEVKMDFNKFLSIHNTYRMAA